MKNLHNLKKYGMKIFGIITIKIIKSNSILEDFLLDNKKDIAGRQIQEIYKLLIIEQNKFIGEIVNIFKKQISEETKINIKKAEKEEIIYLLRELWEIN